MTSNNEIIAEVIEILGDGRYKLNCDDGINRIGLARGTMRRRTFLNTGDKVVLQLLKLETHNIISKVGVERVESVERKNDIPYDENMLYAIIRQQEIHTEECIELRKTLIQLKEQHEQHSKEMKDLIQKLHYNK